MLQDFPIFKYREIKRTPQADPNKPIDESLKKLLINPSFISTGRNNSAIKVRYFRVKDLLSLESEAIIKKYQSAWQQRGYNYICFLSKNDFQAAANADYLLNQSWGNQKWYFTIEKVIDSDSSLETPDGKYFVAFRKVNLRAKTISEELNKLLLSCNIKYNSRDSFDKTLGVKQANLLLNFLMLR